MESPNLPVLLLCRFMTQILFAFYWCVTRPTNGLRKHVECMNLKQKWYMGITFWTWIWKNHTIITWTWLNSEINFWMCTKLITEWVSTISVGLFSFRAMALYLSMHTLFLKNSLKMERLSPWVVMSFGVWFAWKILTPRILAATIIWFKHFNALE